MLLSVFEEKVNIIEEKLSQSIIVSERAATNNPSMHNKVQGIMTEPKKRKGRTDEAIMGDIVTGMIAEFATAELLGVDIFDMPFDLKNPHSYGKDVVYRGIRMEVKSHKHLRHFTVSNHSFDTLLNCRAHQTYDVILFVHVERTENEGFWKATPTVIVDPYPSKEYKFSDLWNHEEFSHVYRADLTAPRKLCYPLIELES